MNGFEFDLHLLGPLVNRLIGELSTPHGWWSAGAVVACLGIAFHAAGWIERRLEARGPERLAVAWAQRVAWPLLALGLMVVVRAVLGRFVPVSLLSVAIAMMVSLAGVRTLVLILRQTFRQAHWVASFERTITTVIWSMVALHILDLLPVLLDTLESIAIPLGKTKLTVLQIITGVLTVGLAGVIALWISNALDAKLAGTSGVDPSARVVIGRIAQPLLMTLALMIALPMVGIDLTTLSVFGGALGVGLGLGMQKIAANYVSGFIILLDRSIEPGRLIRVGTWRGTVVDIRTRYTVLRGMDGIDSIVPNELEQKEPIAGLLNELLFDSRHLMLTMSEQQILEFITTLRGIGMDEVISATLRKAQVDYLRDRPTLFTTSSSNSTAKNTIYSLITSTYLVKNHWQSSCINLSC